MQNSARKLINANIAGNNKNMDYNKEIKIQKNWLEGLIKYAERVEDSNENKMIELAALLGYISSAKTILKYQSSNENS